MMVKLNIGRSKPPTAGLSHGKWEIDPTELTLLEELGSGKFTVKEYVTLLGNFLTLIFTKKNVNCKLGLLALNCKF